MEENQHGLWEADPEVIENLKFSYLDMEGWIEEKLGKTGGCSSRSTWFTRQSSSLGRWVRGRAACAIPPSRAILFMLILPRGSVTK
jgi:hypothetical protein